MFQTPSPCFLRWRLLLSTTVSLTFLQQGGNQYYAIPLLIYFIFRVYTLHIETLAIVSSLTTKSVRCL